MYDEELFVHNEELNVTFTKDYVSNCEIHEELNVKTWIVICTLPIGQSRFSSQIVDNHPFIVRRKGDRADSWVLLTESFNAIYKCW